MTALPDWPPVRTYPCDRNVINHQTNCWRSSAELTKPRNAGVEVQVQVLPDWPYVAQALQMVQATDSWRDPPEFLFLLPRYAC